MKTVGIIGGLGPETTAKFYLEVISLCFRKNKIHRPPMLISNVPMVFSLEERIILGGKTDGFRELLIESAKKLEASGADFIVIPCNTAHVFIEEIRRAVGISVLSIIEESVRHLTKQGINRVGLLATTQTIKARLFDEKCRQTRIKIEMPSSKNQPHIASIINRILNNQQSLADQEELLKIIDEFEDINCILLACTDLQLLISGHKNIKIFDTMHILAESTAKEILEGER